MVHVFVALLLLAGVSRYWVTPARAHEWYPQDCCHDMDCAPVEDVIEVVRKGEALPQLIVTSKHDTAVVRSDFPVREAADDRMHVCMRPSLYGRMSVVCLFKPRLMY
jgi:hypothetical protein